MTPLTKGRGLIYLVGLAAGGLALAGYADFDPVTWEFDLHPVNLKQALGDVIQTAGNAVAALAVWKRWGWK